MKTLDKAVFIVHEVWVGTFNVIEKRLNKVESIVNQAISKRDSKQAEKAFVALRNISSVIESYRNETDVTPKDKAKLFKLRERKNSIYTKLMNSKII